MTTENNTTRHVDDLLPGYHLGALEMDEVDTVERHLVDCSECLEESRLVRAAVSDLALAPPQIAPPAQLRATVLARIQADLPASSTTAIDASQQTQQTQSPEQQAQTVQNLRMVSREGGLTQTAPTTPSRPRQWWRGVVGGVMAASIVILGLSVVNLQKSLNQQTQMVHSLSAVVSLLNHHNAASVHLMPLNPMSPELASATGTLMMAPQDTVALLVVRGLPRANTEYQCWLESQGNQIMVGHITVDQTGHGMMTITAPIRLGMYRSIMISPTSAGPPNPHDKNVLMGKI